GNPCVICHHFCGSRRRGADGGPSLMDQSRERERERGGEMERGREGERERERERGGVMRFHNGTQEEKKRCNKDKSRSSAQIQPPRYCHLSLPLLFLFSIHLF